jgi:mono/diheme cytochrome c family protein
MMKKFWIITTLVVFAAAIVSCGGPRRNPGRAYMPDMSYSRAYETYAGRDTTKFTNSSNDWGSNDGHKIFYSALPVQGTIARGDMLSIYPYKNDSAGYANSASFKSPVNADSIDLKEAERLYLVNCGICHGPKLDGNGPLYKGGDGPFPAKPAQLVGEPKYMTMAEGTMFHSVTYGKNTMGSYASQLNTMQRWMVIAYIKAQQAKAAPAAAATTTAPADTATKKTK